MVQVTLSKPIAWPYPHGLMKSSGAVLEVTDEQLEQLKQLDCVDEKPSVMSAPKTSASPTVHEPQPQQRRSHRFPALPKKSAPVAEWKEYARLNEIKLTGLTKRNEIIGHITKVIDSQ